MLTCDQDHGYTDEQTAFDGGAMDRFVTAVGNGTGTSPEGLPCSASTDMDYYDGNTVRHLELRAALRDERRLVRHDVARRRRAPSTSRPATPERGDELIRGSATDGDVVADGDGGYTLINDAQPYFDDCSNRDAVAMTGQNVGDRLSAWPQLGVVRRRLCADDGLQRPGRPRGVVRPDDRVGAAACGTTPTRRRGTGGTGQWGEWRTTSRTTSLPVLRLDGEPAPPLPTSLAAVGRDTATPGHFDRRTTSRPVVVRLAGLGHPRGDAFPSALPAVSFLKAPALRGRPRGLLGPDR